jgi:putative aldouronate transport system permease protein
MEEGTMQKTLDKTIFNILSYGFITLITLICCLPFIMLISGSFSNEKKILSGGYGILPKEFTLYAYSVIFKDPNQLFRSYLITIFITVTGTALGLFITAMTAYVINRKDFKWRNQFTFFFYFTTLFSGGMVSFYIIMIRYLHFKNNLLALIIPLLLSAFYILIMRNFMKSVPDAITESAKVDGAGDFRIFWQLILPLMKPALASIGMFIALGYWNDWFNAMLFIDDRKIFSLQYLLYRMLSNIQFLKYLTSQANVSSVDLPQETIKLAMTVVAIGPIVMLYPFAQRFFIKGVVIGAVKG